MKLNELVVTGVTGDTKLKNSTAPISIISAKKLHSTSSTNVIDAIAHQPGMSQLTTGSGISKPIIRGLGYNRVVVMSEGVRQEGQQWGDEHGVEVDGGAVYSVEILKGPASLMYGSDAMAGVVNIITKKHTDKGIYADNITRYGSHNDWRQHNTVALNLGKVTSQTNFQMQRNDGWQNTAEEFAEGMVLTDSKNKTVNKFRNWQLAERLTYQPLPSLELYAEGSYYKKNIIRPTNGTHPSCDVYTYDLRYNNVSASAGGKWWLDDASRGSRRNHLTLDVDWNKHAYYYDYTAKHYDYVLLRGEEYGDQNGEWFSIAMLPGQSKLQSDQQRVMAQLKGIFYLPYANTLNAGAEYRYDYLKAPERTETGTASDHTSALYVQDEYTPRDWLNITAGLRLVDNRNFGVRVTPKVSAMLSAGDFRFRLGWSQGFKTPTVKELHYRYLHVMGSSMFFNIGNRQLNPQTSNYYSASIEYRGHRFTASLTGYLNKLDNMIALVNVPVGEIPPGITTAYLGDGSDNVQARMYKNMDDARTSGLDVTLSYQVMKDLTLNAAYSYLDTKAHLYDASKDQMQTVTIDGTAHHKWSASAIYSHTFSPLYKLGVSLSTRGSSTRYYQNNGNGKAYQIWRINTTHDLGKQDKMLAYRIELGVDNLFNYIDKTMHPYHLGNNTSGTTVYATFAVKFNYGKKVKYNKLSTKKQTNNEED